MKKLFFFLALLSFYFIFSQQNQRQYYKINNSESIYYEKPKIFDLFNKIPQNFINTTKDFIKPNYYPYGISAIVSTLALIPFDPWLIKKSRNFAENLRMPPDHKHILKVIPANFNSALYFIGNGLHFILIGTGIATYGLINNDFRAQSTAIQLLESVAISGLFIQPIKRLTGRESPFITENNRRSHSKWCFAPNFSKYQKNTSDYDAMPSGHLTTAMAALTVLIENYPDYKWIKPLGYSMLGLMCFEMMQSKVHWASDYPIALFIGYLIGKNIAKSRIQKNISKTQSLHQKYNLHWSSSFIQGIQTIGIQIQF